MRRFYASPENFNDQQVFLDMEQSRHLSSVLRLTEGNKIRVFDGLGNEFSCEIEKIEKKKTSLKIIEKISPSAPESGLDLTLAVAVLKGEKFDLVIQKAVELGVANFVPLVTKRCDVKIKDSTKKIERWEKIVIESSKQCGRAKLMQISELIEFQDFIEMPEGAKILFAERNGESFSEIKADKKITAVIGSEGGWEDSEIVSAEKKGFQIITLGGRILRSETAAISITGILQHNFGDLR